MKNLTILILLFLTVSGCKKDPVIETPTTIEILSIKEAIEWLNRQSDTSAILKKYKNDFSNAKSISLENGNRIVIPISGQPVYQNIRQGYRQISVHRNTENNNIEAKFLEIIPDAIYFQGKQRVSNSDFTGRIQEFDLNYKLIKGSVYSQGKQIGEIRPSTKDEISGLKNGELRPLSGLFEQGSSSSAHGKIARARMIETCAWYQTTYVDAEGVFTVYSEQICEYSWYDDGGGGYNDGGINNNPPTGEPHGGGGGSSNSDPGPPEPSNLPGENNNNVDPKKMVECFSNVKTEGAAFQVKILVVEPLPGTYFNVGPNSFGHTAIQLTKVNGSQSVTQVLGFYPTGTGLNKLVSKSTIKDNSDIEYTMDASFFTDAESFQKILNYVSNPPKGYHYTEFNCAGFVYAAAKAGNLDVPDPTTTLGFSGPGGAGIGMTPAGWGSALRRQMDANPNNKNISEGGGRAPASKGECK
ncbi:MAG: hypothetical protein REI78_02730 [Pedobacter sp.]|nr:hypothetical protein [Pedobacter sp.]